MITIGETGGHGTFAKVLAGIEVLRRNHIPFAILCVLSSANIDSPEELFYFFASLVPRVVAFNVEELEGFNKQSSLQDRRKFPQLVRFFDIYLKLCEENGFPHRVREFEQASRFFASCLQGNQVKSDVAIPFRILNIDHAGNFSTFSPELMDTLDSRFGNFFLGNILDGKPEDVVDSNKLKRMHEEITAGVDMCAKTCEYFRICGGGAPVNKLAELGTFAGTETAFCRNSTKAIATAMTDRIVRDLRSASR